MQSFFFFFQAEDGIRDLTVTGVQTCALPILEGPIIGTVVFFVLRQTLADLGSLYLLMLGAVAIAVMLFAPKGIWGFLAERFGWQLLPLERRLRFAADARTT